MSQEASRLLVQGASILKTLKESTYSNDETDVKDTFDNIGIVLLEECTVPSLPNVKDVLSSFTSCANEQEKFAKDFAKSSGDKKTKPIKTMADIGLMGPAVYRNAREEEAGVKMSLSNDFFNLVQTSDQEVLQGLASALPETFGTASPIPAPFVCRATNEWMCFPFDPTVTAFSILALTPGTITCVASDIEAGESWRQVTKDATLSNGYLLNKTLSQTLQGAPADTFSVLDFEPGHVLVFRTGSCIKFTTVEKDFCCKVITAEAVDTGVLQFRANALKTAKKNGFYSVGELGLDFSFRRTPISPVPLVAKESGNTKIALLKTEANALLAQVALLNPHVWDVKKEAAIRSKLAADESEKKLAKQIRGILDTLIKSIETAKKEEATVLPEVLLTLASIRTQLDLIKPHEETMKETMSKKHISYVANMTKSDGWAVPGVYLMNQMRDITIVHGSVEKLVPAVLEKLKNGKGKKRERTPTATVVVVPTVDPETFKETHVDDGSALEAWERSFNTKVPAFATMVQASNDPAVVELFQKAKESVALKLQEYHDNISGVLNDEASAFNITIPNGYVCLLNQMIESIKGPTKKATKQIKCQSCEARRTECRGSGMCAQCYRVDILPDITENMDLKITAASTCMGKEAFSNLFLKEDGSSLVDDFYALIEHVDNSSANSIMFALESLETCIASIEAKLPADLNIENSFIDDDDDNDDDDNDNAAKHKGSEGWNKLPNDYEEEEESFDSSDSEDAPIKKNTKKRGRVEEDTPESLLAAETLTVCAALPVLSIRNELIMMYADTTQHKALAVRITHYKSTVHKVFGVIIRDKVDPSLDPFEHETFFLEQRDAIEARNKYNLLPNYAAEILTRQIAW